MYKTLLIGLGAAAAAGVGAAVVAPWIGSRALDPTKPSNWPATGAIAMLLGAAVAYGGNKMDNDAVAVAGAGAMGAGASFLFLNWQAQKMVASMNTKTNPKLNPDGTLAAGIVNFGSPSIPVAPGAMPAYVLNQGRGSSHSSFGGFGPTGVPLASQRYAQKGGMPTRSGMHPYGNG